MGNLNYWSSFKNYDAAAWLISFPEAEGKVLLTKLFREILLSGLKHDVLVFKDNEGEFIGADAINLIIDNPEIDVFSCFLEQERYEYYTKLSFFSSEGDLRVEYVDDVGDLLKRLNSEERIDREYSYTNKALRIRPPMSFDGETSVILRIPTDIWMPHVFNFRRIEREKIDKSSDNSKDKLLSNKILYKHNTLRLNSFLAGIFLTVKDLGGKVVVEDDLIWEPYIPFVTDSGISEFPV